MFDTTWRCLLCVRMLGFVTASNTVTGLTTCHTYTWPPNTLKHKVQTLQLIVVDNFMWTFSQIWLLWIYRLDQNWKIFCHIMPIFFKLVLKISWQFNHKKVHSMFWNSFQFQLISISLNDFWYDLMIIMI